jgi:hypothetical protein
MAAAASASLLVAGTAWQVTGFGPAGRRLVAAADHGAEDEQAVAGMLLVRAGDRSVRLVADALARGATSPVLVDVLASIGTPAARAALARAAQQAPASEVAAAAADALRILDQLPPEPS